MAGAIYLLGGGEPARRETEAIDRQAVAEAGAAPVAVFIGAATGSRAQAAAFVGYFRHLGARPLDAALYSREDAADPDVLDRIQQGDILYLGGGDPRLLIEALEGTPGLAAIREAQHGGALLLAMDQAAFAAGAFVAADDEWPSGRPGLDLLDGWAVMPRFDEPERRRSLQEMLSQHAGLRGLGVRPKSAAVLRDGTLEALGGTLELYSPNGELMMVRSGHAISLEEDA